MEADIELRFNYLTAYLEIFRKSLPNNYIINHEIQDDKNSEIILRYKEDKLIKVETNVGVVIENFLKNLKAIFSFLDNSKGYIRLGTFYNFNETAVCPLILSVTCVKIMADLNLYLDSTGYIFEE